MRQNRIWNPDNQRHKLMIIGAGSTGSFLALTLAKMGWKDIKVIDYDTIDETNISNQMWKISDIGKAKTEALQDTIKEYSGTTIKTENIKIDENYFWDIDNRTIVIFALDSLKARLMCYEALKDYPIRIIDGRFGAQGWEIWNINLAEDIDKEHYEKSLKAEPQDTECGLKGIMYSIMSMIGDMGNIIKRIDTAETTPKVIKRNVGGQMGFKYLVREQW